MKENEQKPSEEPPESDLPESTKSDSCSDDAEGDPTSVIEGNDDVQELHSIVQSAMYTGPLPPPKMLQQYEEVLPGMADRIMSMAEREQRIRGRDNGWLVFNDLSRIIGSVVVSLGLVGGAIYCAILDQPAVAIAMAASGLIPQIVRFFNGSREK